MRIHPHTENEEQHVLGWFCAQDARRRVNARKENGQNLQADGQKHGREALP